MIEPVVLTGGFERHHVLHILHDADGGAVAASIGADVALIGVADVVAVLAKHHFVAQPHQGIGQSMGGGSIFSQQMEHEAQGRFSPHPGEFSHF